MIKQPTYKWPVSKNSRYRSIDMPLFEKGKPKTQYSSDPDTINIIRTIASRLKEAVYKPNLILLSWKVQ